MNQNEEQTKHIHTKFIDELCELLVRAHEQYKIPIEVIYLNLQCHSHDMMTHIVNNSKKYIDEVNEEQARQRRTFGGLN